MDTTLVIRNHDVMDYNRLTKVNQGRNIVVQYCTRRFGNSKF